MKRLFGSSLPCSFRGRWYGWKEEDGFAAGRAGADIAFRASMELIGTGSSQLRQTAGRFADAAIDAQRLTKEAHI